MYHTLFLVIIKIVSMLQEPSNSREGNSGLVVHFPAEYVLRESDYQTIVGSFDEDGVDSIAAYLDAGIIGFQSGYKNRYNLHNKKLSISRPNSF